MNVLEKRPAIYTAFSKHFFFAKMQISAYVLNKGCIPLNPFTNWSFFMEDMVERSLVVRGNNNLILLADEVWTFGPIADGVFTEIKLANSLNKPVRHYSAGNKIEHIQPLPKDQLVFEDELLQQLSKEEIYREFDKENLYVEINRG